MATSFQSCLLHGLSTKYIYNAAKTVADPNATGAEKSLAVGGAVLSVVAPGGGYGTAGKVAASAADKVGDVAKVADKVGDVTKGEMKLLMFSEFLVEMHVLKDSLLQLWTQGL